MGKIVALLLVPIVAALVAIYMCPDLLKERKVPEVPDYRWWGPGLIPPGALKAKLESRPFRVQVQDSALQDLKERLRNTRLLEPLEGVDFQYGFNTKALKPLLDYWLTTYDWRKEEARLNQYPQFLVKIEGIDVHYIHVKPAVSEKVKVFPLLLVHGWPGSVVEFYKIIPLLTSGESGVAFEVICPSIPGYGFSEAPHHPGYTLPDAARTFAKLMDSLGHSQFYVQGGDWGSYIVQTMSLLYPEKVRGLHVNFLSVSILSPKLCPLALLKYIVALVSPSLIMEPDQKYNVFPFSEVFSNMFLETGYFHIQATKPDTLGVGLGDSPAGLAAYILEKFSTGTNFANRDKQDGGLLEKFSRDELLTNLMVYWITNSITSSVRFYKEAMVPKNKAQEFSNFPIPVPAGVAVFPNEISTFPRTIASHRFRQLLTYNHMERGGHFAALEEPQLLADDIRTFVFACEDHLKLQAESQTQEKKSKVSTSDKKPEKIKASKPIPAADDTKEAEKVVKREEPKMKTEPKPKKEEPKVKKEEPKAKKEEVKPKKEEPKVKTEEPKPKKEEPKPKKEEPKPKKEEPKPKKEEPKPKKEEQKTKTEEPKPKKEEPKTKTEEPKPKKEEPKSTQPTPKAQDEDKKKDDRKVTPEKPTVKSQEKKDSKSKSETSKQEKPASNQNEKPQTAQK